MVLVIGLDSDGYLGIFQDGINLILRSESMVLVLILLTSFNVLS